MPRIKGRKSHAADTTARRSTRGKATLKALNPTSVKPIALKRGPGRPRKIQDEAPEVKAQARRGRPARVVPSPQILPKRGRPAKVVNHVPARRGRPPKNAKRTATTIARPSSKIVKYNVPIAKVTKKCNQGLRTSIAPAVKVNLAQFSIKNIAGEYAIKCRAISANWSDDFTYDMRINTRRADDEGRVTAAFDFGFITGTLRLSRSEADLKDWCDPDDQEVQEPVTPSSSPPVERQSTPTPDSNGPRRSKRSKSEEMKNEDPAYSDRVYLQWRGLSSVSEARYLDDVKQVGWFDFPRADGAIFWGCIDFPQTLGAGIWVQGTRISKKSAAKPVPWDVFEDTAVPGATDVHAEKGASEDVDTLREQRAPTVEMINGGTEDFESGVQVDVPETQFA